MMRLFQTAIFSLLLLCDGRPLGDDDAQAAQPIEPALNLNDSDNLKDLMKVIMEALDSAKLTGEGFTPNEEQVETLVMELSPEKRKILNEILGLVVNSPENDLLHRPQYLKKPQVAKQVEVFTLPPGRSINIQELLKFLIQPSATTPSDLEHLKRIIYDNHMSDLQHDPILKRTFNKFLLDSNLQSHEIDHLN